MGLLKRWRTIRLLRQAKKANVRYDSRMTLFPFPLDGTTSGGSYIIGVDYQQLTATDVSACYSCTSQATISSTHFDYEYTPPVFHAEPIPVHRYGPGLPQPVPAQYTQLQYTPATCRGPPRSTMTEKSSTWEEVLEEERNIREQANGFIYGKIKTECRRCAKPMCCDQMFEVSPWEAYLIGKAHPELIHTLGPKLVEQAAAEKPFYENQEKYFDLRRPCAFLKDGKCQVYDVRPLICTTMHLLKGEKLCDEMNPKEQHRIGIIPDFSAMYMRLSKHSWEASLAPHIVELGGDDIPYGFIPGLATAMVYIGSGTLPPYTDRKGLLTYLEKSKK